MVLRILCFKLSNGSHCFVEQSGSNKNVCLAILKLKQLPKKTCGENLILQVGLAGPTVFGSTNPMNHNSGRRTKEEVLAARPYWAARNGGEKLGAKLDFQHSMSACKTA